MGMIEKSYVCSQCQEVLKHIAGPSGQNIWVHASDERICVPSEPVAAPRPVSSPKISSYFPIQSQSAHLSYYWAQAPTGYTNGTTVTWTVPTSSYTHVTTWRNSTGT